MLSDCQRFSEQSRFLIEALRVTRLTYIFESMHFGGRRGQLGEAEFKGAAANTAGQIAATSLLDRKKSRSMR